MVDNLPPQLLPTLAELAEPRAGRGQPDRRRGRRAQPGVLRRPASRARASSARPRRDPRVVFLEATDDVLVRRYESVRRPHPLQGDGRLLDGIAARARAAARPARRGRPRHRHLRLNVHELRAKVVAALRRRATRPACRSTVMSFGFKYGLPVDADLVVDCRFLPNPHWVPELRPLTGPRRGRSRDYVLGQPGADGVPRRVRRAAASSWPHGYQREGKRYVTLAVGCTGGKHRSVAMPRSSRGRLRGRRRRRVRSCTATWGGSERRPAAAAPAVGRARRRARAGRVAVGAAPRHRPSSPRSSPSPTTAARAAGCAREFGVLPPGRPADGAGRAVRRRRVGPHLGATSLQHRFAGDGDAARARGRQPADRRAVGAARRHGRAAWTGSAGCSARRAGCCRWRPCRSTSWPRCVGLDPDEPGRARARCAARSRCATHAGPGRGVRLAARPDPPACPEAVDGVARRRLGRPRARAPGSPACMPHLLVPELRDGAGDDAGPRLVVAQPERRSRGRPTASRPENHLEVLPRTRLTRARRRAGRPRPRSATGRRCERRPRRSAPSSSWPIWLAERTRTTRHDRRARRACHAATSWRRLSRRTSPRRVHWQPSGRIARMAMTAAGQGRARPPRR